MFTSGTAVPGTVVSTTQDVQAAEADYNEINSTSTTQDVLDNVLKAFESWSPTKTVFVEGNTYNPTDTEANSSAEISGFVKNVLKWDNTSDNVYSKNGFELTVSPAEYADSKNNIVNKVTFKVSKTGVAPATSSNIPLTGIEYYNSDRVAAILDSVDLSDVEVTSADTTLTVKSKVENYIKELLKDELPAEIVEKDIKVTATVTKNIIDDNRTVEYRVTANVCCGSDDNSASITIKNGTFTVSNAVSDEAKAAMDYLKTELTEVKVGAADDLNPSANPENATDAITNKAKELLNATEYADYAKNVTASGTILTKGVWTGTITLKGDNDVISDTFEINLTTDAAEDRVIVKIELVEPKDEVEITENLNDVVKLRLERQDGTVEVKTINEAVSTDKTIVYDKTTLNNDGTFKNLGTYSVTFHTTNTATTPTATFTTTVVRTTNKNNINTNLGVSTYSAVTTSDSSVLVPVFDADGNFSGLKALKAGTVTITAIDKSGATFETEVTVKADGTLKYGDPELQATDRVVVNTAANLGFVATDVKSTSQKPVVLDSDTVAKAEIDTLNGVSVIRITPVARGTAEFKVTGGVDKDLETTITVEVKKDGEVTVTPTTVKVTKVTATNSTASKLSKLVINTDKLKENVATVYDIDNLGLTSSDNLVITTTDNKTHRVPALDADKVTVTKNGNTVELKLYYGIANSSKSNIYTVTLGVNNTMISNDIETLGIVATQVDSVKNSVAEAVENNWVDVEITEDSEDNPVVLISKGKDAPNSGTATITLSDDNGLTAVITATFTNGVLTAKVSGKCTQQLAMAVAPDKREYTLGEDVNAAGGFFTYTDSQEKGHKVSLTSEMLNIDTTESTYEYNSKKDEYTNEPVDITVSYGKTSEMPAQKSTEDDAQATYTVKPATSTVSTSTLGLASDEKILSVALKGDAVGTDNLVVLKDAEGRSLSIAALKTEVSGAAVLTTNKGNSISVSISVDENGAIASEVVKAFKSSIKTIKNDNDTLGMTATEATSDNTSVALVNMAGDRITITSVAPGTATITVTDGSNYALIPVSVDEFGNITIGDIQKVGDDGFVRGEAITEGEYAGLDNWYYYIDGKMVTNNWVEVNENGTNVWYHFDKDGKMSRGWIIDESGWKIYNLDSNGRMRKDMWINAAANDALGMPAGLYHLQSDGAVQMNGWAESVTAGIYWYCNAGTGLFEQGNPASWSNSKLW